MWARPFERLSVLAGAAISLAACSAPPLDSAAQGVAACTRGASHDEIRDSGPVVRVLGIRGSHEGFIVRLEGQTYRVEDNVDLSGAVPLRRGDRVTLQGQLECDDYAIHWTHHDPAARHIGGYIEVDDKFYQ